MGIDHCGRLLPVDAAVFAREQVAVRCCGVVLFLRCDVLDRAKGVDEERHANVNYFLRE